MMPGTGKYLITTNVIHPGFNLGVSLAIKENKYNLWLTKLRVGYFHHRLSQQALQLFGEMAYRYKLFNDHLGLEAGIAGGYLHAFRIYKYLIRNQMEPILIMKDIVDLK